MSMRNNPISSTIDADKQGIQHGFLRLPYSRNDSAWGAIVMPITQFLNGTGPTALLTGGNHGDEYEGPIALYRFTARERIDDIQGRVIVIPAMNYPAFKAASRVSPIDQVNLNRAFPGRADGTVTQIIADYFSRILLPGADYVLDMHSGGKTLEFLPFSACHRLPDPEQDARCDSAMRAFAAPYQLRMLEIDSGGMYDTQAENMGKVFVTTELGGGGTTRTHSIEVACRGVNNFLKHAGILQGEIEQPSEAPLSLDMPDGRSYLFAEHEGLLEPCVDLGTKVHEGQLIARIYSVERSGIDPVDYHAPRDGLVIGRHVPSLVKMGDCLNVIAKVVG